MVNDYQNLIIEDIKRVARELDTNKLSRSDYLSHGNFSAYQLYDDGKNWSQLCSLAGIKSKTKIAVSDNTYFNNLAEAVRKLGRYPLASERKKFKLNFSKRRFPNLSSFIDEAIKLGFVPDFHQNKINDERKPKLTSSIPSITKIKLTSGVPCDEIHRQIPAIPIGTKRKRWERTELPGFPYAPQEEQGVLAIFAILCAKGRFPWQILDISAGKGIDTTCFDEINKREIQIELKYILSKGNWNHPFDSLDYVVCWENRWPDFPKPVVELSIILKEQR